MFSSVNTRCLRSLVHNSIPSVLLKLLWSYTSKLIDCSTVNWVQEVTVLISGRSSHSVALLDPWGPTVLEILEILLYSVPKAFICYGTEAERTIDIEELLLDVAFQGHLAHPTTPMTSNSMVLSWPLHSPRCPPPKKVFCWGPTLPSSLLQLSLCARELDELLEFPEPHKGRGSHPGTVGSCVSQTKVWAVRGAKAPLTSQSFPLANNMQYSYISIFCRTRQSPEELKSICDTSQARLRHPGDIRHNDPWREEAARKRMISSDLLI